jgi:hypothetical protein
MKYLISFDGTAEVGGDDKDKAEATFLEVAELVGWNVDIESTEIIDHEDDGI